MCRCCVNPRPSLFADLSDDQLIAEVKRLAATERQATATLIRALMELDARRLYLGEGYSSLFTYCTQALYLAEGAAYNRIEAARAASRFPIILKGLEDGSLTPTAVRLLAPHLTVENHEGVLKSARNKRKQAIEEIIASLNPKPRSHTSTCSSCDSWRRPGGNLRSCVDVALEGTRAAAVCGGGIAAPFAGSARAIETDPRRGQARSVAARRRAVCVRRTRWPVRRAELP